MTKKENNKNPHDQKILGLNLQNLRQEAGLSRQDMGRILGVSVQQIQKYESGKNRLPLERLFVLKHIFDVPYDLFFKHLTLPWEKQQTSPILRDPIAQDIYVRMRALKNESLKKKIRDIVFILAEQPIE